MSTMWADVAGVVTRVLFLGLCLTAGAATLYAVTFTAMNLGGYPAYRRRINHGQATRDDAWRYAARHLKSRALPLHPEVSTRMAANPPFVVEWLRAGEDWDLLTTGYRAGLSDTELAAHLNHTHRLTVEQVGLLVALRTT